MSTTPVIRPASVADLETIVALFEELDRYHQEFEPDLVHQGTPRSAKVDGLKDFLTNDDFVLRVAEVDGAIAGFARMQIEDRNENRVFRARRVATVHELSVSKTHRNHGVGRQLMEALHDEAKQRNVEFVTLTHFARNEGTGAFYDAIGYRPYMRHMILDVRGE